jgi:glucose/arabinose dehydrogenase
VRLRVARIAAAAAVLGASAAAPAVARAEVVLERAGSFHQPVAVAGPQAEPRVHYVLERAGRIWRVGPGGRRRLFLDARRYVRLILPRDHFRDQGGAFALAFPPGYRRGGRVYLLYTRDDGRVHLDEFRPRRGGRPGRPGRPRTVLSLPRRSRVDVGGDAAFGPDGLLYASFGYGRDPQASQAPGSLNGKVVRLDPGDEDAEPELVALGLRVPWRMSFHRGRLVVADVGEARVEEVNLLPLTADGPANLGWPFFEGRTRRLPGGPSGLTMPALSLRHGRLMCAIVGGHVVRGRYLYGDVCSGELRSARLAGRRAVDDRPENTSVPYLVSFGRDGGGRVYAVSIEGGVFRVR